jgi:hypothetical protein
MRQLDDNFIYVEHVLAEHQRLDQLIRRTLATCPNREEPDLNEWISRTTTSLKLIRRELAHHFREEEQGGCLEEAVARCPALSADAQALEGEHAQLLSELDWLICRCELGMNATANEVRDIQGAVEALVHKLRAHEARENRVMQRGFGVCLEDREAGCQVS